MKMSRADLKIKNKKILFNTQKSPGGKNLNMIIISNSMIQNNMTLHS